MTEWKTSDELVLYEDALSFMDERVALIRGEGAQDCVWLLEHPPLYTGGTSSKDEDLLNTQFPVYETGRGGEYTYHGPGQRVAYVMMDLHKRQKTADVKAYVCDLENWIIKTLAAFDIKGERRAGRIGVWVEEDGTEKKIAAIGVRVRRWVSFHGIALNVSPDLSHFDGIVPCGIKEFGVTSIAELLGRDVSMEEVDDALKAAWVEVF
ncbi:MAG: lipoyl(octanoyl) transferase LipB [Pseudomonadota bacterium]